MSGLGGGTGELNKRSPCLVGTLRVYYTYQDFLLAQSSSPGYDAARTSLSTWVCTAVEANVVVLCAAAPALRAYSGHSKSRGRTLRSFGWYRKMMRTDGLV